MEGQLLLRLINTLCEDRICGEAKGVGMVEWGFENAEMPSDYGWGNVHANQNVVNKGEERRRLKTVCKRH